MIAVITASPRTGSRSALVAAALSDMLLERGQELIQVRLQQLLPDLARFMETGIQEGIFLERQEQLISVRKMLFVVPEYNGGFPGILKYWIDSSRFPNTFAGKKAALAGLGDGMFGNVRGLDHLSAILNYCQMTVMPYRMHLPKIGTRLLSGPIHADEDFSRQAERLVNQFIEF